MNAVNRVREFERLLTGCKDARWEWKGERREGEWEFCSVISKDVKDRDVKDDERMRRTRVPVCEKEYICIEINDEEKEDSHTLN